MTAKDVFGLPLALRALQDELDGLLKEEGILSRQTSFLGRQLRKKRKDVVRLEESFRTMKTTFDELSKAKIASIEEFKKVRLVLSGTKELLTKARKEARELDKNGKNTATKLKNIKRDIERVQGKIGQWNKVIQWKR